jgi:hypothetical protein
VPAVDIIDLDYGRFNPYWHTRTTPWTNVARRALPSWRAVCLPLSQPSKPTCLPSRGVLRHDPCNSRTVRVPDLVPRGCWAPGHGVKVGSLKHRLSFQRGLRRRLASTTQTAGSSCFPVPAVTPLAFDASAPSRPRSRARPLRPLAICASARWPSRLSTLGLGITVTPSRPQVLRLADCDSGAVPILSFPPPFLSRAWQAGDISCALAARRFSAFPPRETLRVSGPSQKDWPSFALAVQRIFFFDPPGKSEAWPGEQAPPAL